MEVFYQPFCFLGLFYFGIIAGMLYEVANLLIKSFKENRIIKFLLCFIWAILCGAILFFALNYINFGQIRLYLIFSFIIGIAVERKLLGFFVDGFIVFVYNLIKIVVGKLKLFKGRKKQNDTKKH